MKKPTVEQIAEVIYLTMPLTRRDQVLDTAKAIHDLIAEYNKSKIERITNRKMKVIVRTSGGKDSMSAFNICE